MFVLLPSNGGNFGSAWFRLTVVIVSVHGMHAYISYMRSYMILIGIFDLLFEYFTEYFLLLFEMKYK